MKRPGDRPDTENSEEEIMLKKKEPVSGVVYTDIGTISDTSRRATRKRKKEAKKAKEQMKANRKKARQAKTVQAENGVIIAMIIALCAGAGLLIWQTVVDAKNAPQDAGADNAGLADPE